MSKLGLYYRTLKHLKASQLWHLLWHRLSGLSGPRSLLQQLPAEPNKNITLQNPIAAYPSYVSKNTFVFLNLTHTFSGAIDWNFAAHGKLWTYNLAYFDFLHQPEITADAGLALMHDFANQYHAITDGHEPYPTSLRVMNWVKFVARHQLSDATIDRVIFTDLKRLLNNLE